jgi:hypothetical protein
MPSRKPSMSGKGRLLGGLERVLPDHRSALGKALRREFHALLASLAPDGDPLLRREASRVALLAVRSRESGRVWAELAERRRLGRGRRPSPRMVERAARRAALDDASHVQALDRLRGLAAQHRPDPLKVLLARRAAGQQEPS